MEKRNLKRYTVGEEIFNSVSHGVTALLAVIGCTVMVTLSASFGNRAAVISSVAFGLSMVLLYTMSTLYHAFPFEKTKKVFRVFDHTSIPILIAGSYTPFCLITLSGSDKGIFVAATVWICALVSVILSSLSLEKFEKLNLLIYIAMGWTALAALKDILKALPKGGFILLLAGGLVYTVGIIFYKMKKVKYAHSIWHLFVSAGSVLHFLCIVIYVLPRTYCQ